MEIPLDHYECSVCKRLVPYGEACSCGGKRTEYNETHTISFDDCRAGFCKSKAVPCIKGWTNVDGTVVKEWCEIHEKEVHELPGYAH